MQRRWKITLEAMSKEGIDCLVLSENGCWEGGNPGAAIYLTDIHPGNYTQYFLFSKDGITVLSCGAKGDRMLHAEGMLNVVENIAIPAIPSTTYAWTWYPEELAKIIKKNGYRKIGFVGMHNVTAGTYKYLTENLSECEFCDFTDQLDHIKAVKSEYELRLWTSCVYLHDDLLAAVPTVLRVGLTCHEVARKIRILAEDMGCTQMNIMIGGKHYWLQDKVIEKGEYVNVLVEVADHRNIWAEVGRVFAMGMDPSPAMLKAVDDQHKIMDFVAANSVPGVKSADVFSKTNEMLTGMGYNAEKRFSVHGQGYEIVDRPMWTAEETMVLEENMFYANHPIVANSELRYTSTDNYVIKKGGSVKLSRTPRGIIVCRY